MKRINRLEYSTQKTKMFDGESEECDHDTVKTLVEKFNNKIYFYSDVSMESVLKLNKFLAELGTEYFTTSMKLGLSINNEIPLYLYINSDVWNNFKAKYESEFIWNVDMNGKGLGWCVKI